MAQPDLTSHHVNYLIWRYLQESGHGEAAVSLQRAWYPEPQNLPFARHIQTHALVSLVQKGLQYHELESSIDKPFELAALKSREEAGTDHPAPEPARDRVTNGHPPEAPGMKRKGETNGDSMDVDAETESKSGSPNPGVDVDGDVSMGADEVPQEPTISTGASASVQISPAKSADLTSDTACLDLDDHVINTAWRPGDPTMLVTRGESFCSLWKLSSSSAPVQNKFVDLKTSESYVSAVAWDGIGDKLAVASMRDMKGAITMYNAEGNVVDMLPDLPRIINGLYWAENTPQLVIVASNEKDCELALWDGTQRPDEYQTMVIRNRIYDLVWTGRNEIFACGDGTVYQCSVDRNIHLIKEYTSDRETPWTFIRSTETSHGPVVVVAGYESAADSETAVIWIPTHDIIIENAQKEPITAIDIRPQSPAQRRNSSITGKSPIAIVTYSADGTTNVWDVDLEQKEFQRVNNRFHLASDIPIFAGGFSPDGYALAGVSKDRLFIWNAERGGDYMAVWTAPGSKEVKEEADAPTNGQNGHTTRTECTLSWDTDGKKLAYGFGNKVSLPHQCHSQDS
ncbi:hypothetical protein N7507_006252 [Penicillium longicatenatum]|nr:hypothetical protein N7507_006252 [Penicillium longicatenatum]